MLTRPRLVALNGQRVPVRLVWSNPEPPRPAWRLEWAWWGVWPVLVWVRNLPVTEKVNG